MTLKGEPEFFPRMPGQQADVMPGSALAVLALLAEIIRERFRPKNQLAWAWSENPTPDVDEENTVDAPRKILIEPSFAENNETRNYRPAILVDKQDTIPSKVAIGNFVGQQLHTGLRGFYSIATIPIDINIVSDRNGESAILADIVWFYLLAGREPIMKTFGMQDMSNPILGRTTPQDVDRRVWSTHITFTIGINLRWSTLPISPILRDVVTRYKTSGETDFDTFLLSQHIS
jgi:hypothetical protein